MKLNILILFICFLGLQSANAHALWISTDQHGTIGKSQEIKIYFAEPGETWEPIGGKEWELAKNFELWLISPKGEKEQLNVLAKSDHYIASFVPNENGVYHVELKNENIGILKFEGMPPFIPYFYSSSLVTVGTLSTQNKKSDTQKVVPIWNKMNQIDGLMIAISSDIKGKLAVVMPDGSIKNLGEVGTGKVEFKPEKPGIYQVELSTIRNKALSNDLNSDILKIYTSTTVFQIP